ncbi:MAG: hypothetical protein ACOYIQ_04235 [Christensenellales bacterium]|jgi:hypothetical protein
MKIAKIVVVILLLAALGTGVVIACPNEGKRVVKQDTYFSFDSTRSSVKGISTTLLLNNPKSGVILRRDGTVTITLAFKDSLSTLVGSIAIEDSGEFANVLNMLYEYLPGLDFSDINKVIEVFEGGLGVTLIGLDPGDTAVAAMFSQVALTGQIPNEIVIPSGFGLQINARYYIQDKVSPVTGVKYTGVFLGNPHPDGESFLILDLEENSSGKQEVILNFPLINLYMVAVENA